MIETIEIKGEVAAIIMRTNYTAQGINFVTPDDYSLQLAYMNRPQGYQIQPHVHQQVARQFTMTQEVLWIKNGKVRVDFYDQDKNYESSTILEKGDVILLASCGHGFEILEAAEIIEVKQGPYAGDRDKIRFDAVDVEKRHLNIN